MRVSDISMKIFSLQEKQETMEGSVVFARFLTEPREGSVCYKTEICMPSQYHIRMLIKAKHRSAMPHSLGEAYSPAWGALCKLYAKEGTGGNLSAFTMEFIP